MLDKFGLDISRFTRSRRKRAGIAPTHYLRHRNFWVLLCGHGLHKFFEIHRKEDPNTEELVPTYHDIRSKPLNIWFDWDGELLAYSIAHAGGKAKVQIERGSYLRLKTYFVDIATKRSINHLVDAFYHVPYEPYGRVVYQLFCINEQWTRRERPQVCRARFRTKLFPEDASWFTFLRQWIRRATDATRYWTCQLLREEHLLATHRALLSSSTLPRKIGQQPLERDDANIAIYWGNYHAHVSRQ